MRVFIFQLLARFAFFVPIASQQLARPALFIKFMNFWMSKT